MRISTGLAFNFLLVCCLSAVEPSMEERLSALERQVQNLAKENADLKKELGWQDAKSPALVRPVGKEARLSVGGFLQAQGEFGHAADPRWAGVKDRFYFRRARIYVGGSFTEDFDFKAELDLQGNSSSASTGLLARANEVYVGWRKYPQAVVRFGQLKSAFGGEQLASDTKLFAIERALSNDRLTDGRQFGFTVGGEVLDNKVSYLVMLANGNGTNVSANDNSGFQKSAHVYYTPVATKEDKVVLGAGVLTTTDVGASKSGFGLPGNLFTGSRDAWGVDGEWTHGRLNLFSEYLHNTFKPATGAGFSADGWQATAAYFLVPAKIQALVRHEQFDPNTAVGGDRIRSWTVGINYLIKNEDLRLMLNYIYGEVPGSTKDGGRLLTRMQVLF
jgi:phosphate-selective porin OprO and OprP